MTSITSTAAPIADLLSLVAHSLERQPGDDTTLAPAPAGIADLPQVLGPMAQGWLALKGDGQAWMVLQFAPCPAEAAPAVQAVVQPVAEPVVRPSEARALPTRPEFGARARRVHTALTEREREVLCLVAGGATNRAIGRRLFISPKTASVHVSRILTKLDATTRTEAAALAHAAGLVRPWGLADAASDSDGPHAVGA
jgi:DNA-binding CsgD family transcriptional regulator